MSKEQGKIKLSLSNLVLYFLKLGTIGFGGPIALVGYMQRDLQEKRNWITKEEYLRGLTLSQLAPVFERYAKNPKLISFVQGITAATTGAIAGAIFGLLFPPWRWNSYATLGFKFFNHLYYYKTHKNIF